jgi:hypothetical protein
LLTLPHEDAPLQARWKRACCTRWEWTIMEIARSN